MNNDIEQEINLQTAKIYWHELQRFFASGNAIAVDPSLDLTHVAAQIVADNAAQIKTWMDAGMVDAVLNGLPINDLMAVLGALLALTTTLAPLAIGAALRISVN